MSNRITMASLTPAQRNVLRRLRDGEDLWYHRIWKTPTKSVVRIECEDGRCIANTTFESLRSANLIGLDSETGNVKTDTVKQTYPVLLTELGYRVATNEQKTN